jgi:hypothetical protein
MHENTMRQEQSAEKLKSSVSMTFTHAHLISSSLPAPSHLPSCTHSHASLTHCSLSSPASPPHLLHCTPSLSSQSITDAETPDVGYPREVRDRGGQCTKLTRWVMGLGGVQRQSTVDDSWEGCECTESKRPT